MRRLVVLLALVLATLAWPQVPALAPEDIVVYLDESGHIRAGVLPVGIEGVSQAIYSFTPDDCRRSLRIHLDYAPRNASVDADVLYLATPYEWRARLLDAQTGQELRTHPWRSPGSIRWDVDEARPLRLELTLLRGAAADYHVRVIGWVHPDAECTLRNQILVTEVEANPSGADADAEWVEILNHGFSDIDLQGWRIVTTHGVVKEHVFIEPTPLPMGARIQVVFDGQFLDNEDESVRLLAPKGWLIDQTPFVSDTANDGRSWQREEDGSGAWTFRKATPGAPNA